MRRRACAAGSLTIVCILHGCSPGPKPPVEPARPAPTVSASASALATAPPSPPPVGETEDAKLIAKALKKLAKTRGLVAKRPVPGVALERKDLIAKIKDKVAREIPPDAIRREAQWLALYGFIPTSFDYLDATMKLLEAQLAGFYEPKGGTMFLAMDLDPLNAEATLAHELVHALQDQYWDLESRSKYRPGESDAQSAISALAEGDATSAMTDILMAKLGGRTAIDLDDDDFAEQILAGMNTGPSAQAPHIMRTSLASAYVEGIRFVNARRRIGGWKAVDAVWARPPTTTEQILHPEKWDADERAIAIPIPPGAVLGAGFKKVDDDVSGEIALALAFDEWAPGRGTEAARGWGGDRDAMYVEGDKVAGVLHLRYDADTKGGAERAFRIVTDGWARTVATPTRKEAAFACVERKELGPLAIAWRKDDLAMAAGPATTAPRWASASTCAEAKRWLDDVLR